MDYIFGPAKGPELPVVVMARDEVKLPVEGGPTVENQPSPIEEVWQRWNDYGIGLLLEGEALGSQKGELAPGRAGLPEGRRAGHAPTAGCNLARVYLREGRIPDARKALEEASNHPKPAAPWVIAWLSGQIDERNGYLDEAIARYESVLATRIPDRGFDFSLDYEVINALGLAPYARARQEPLGEPGAARITSGRRWRPTGGPSRSTPRTSPAHHGLGLAYAEPGDRRRRLDARRPAPDADPESIRALARSATDPKRDRRSRAVGGPAARPGGRRRSSPALGRSSARGSTRSTRSSRSSGPPSPPSPTRDARAAQARALPPTHKALHAMFKPDETAEGRAVGIARQEQPGGRPERPVDRDPPPPPPGRPRHRTGRRQGRRPGERIDAIAIARTHRLDGSGVLLALLALAPARLHARRRRRR